MTTTPAEVTAAARALCDTWDTLIAQELRFLAELSAAMSDMHARADAQLATIRTLRGELFPCGAAWPMRAESQAAHLDACMDARCAVLGARLLGMVGAA